MGKIGILTHYDVNNQGAQLQMYATAAFLKDNNYDSIILTYKKNYDFNVINEKRNQISIKSIPYILKEFLFKKGLCLTLFNTKKYLANKKFRENNFNFDNYATSDCSAIIIGSDECLSLESGANMMMYGHSCCTDKIIYYAPSFGQTSIEEMMEYNCYNLIKSGIGNIKFLSARDDNTQTIMKQLSVDNNVVKVCDPVLLYDFSNIKSKVNLPKKKYMLIYGYDKNFMDKAEIEQIKNFAKEHNLKTVSAGTYHKWCDYNYNCDCLQWIEYFRNAEFVLTDTFHGSITSIINNKKVAIKIRKQLNNNKLSDLINTFGLQKANIEEITKDNLNKVFENNIDYELFNNVLIEKRKESKDYLLGALNEYNRQ